MRVGIDPQTIPFQPNDSAKVDPSFTDIVQRRPLESDTPVQLGEDADLESRIDIIFKNRDHVFKNSPMASRNIFQFLLNEPNVLVIVGAGLSDDRKVNDAQNTNNERFFEKTLANHSDRLAAMNVGDEITLSDHWDRQTNLVEIDPFEAFGSVTINSHADITIRRTKEGFDVVANVSHLTFDHYDWHGIGAASGWTRLPGGEVVELLDREMGELKKAGKASPFHVASLEEQVVVGSVTLQPDNTLRMDGKPTVKSSAVVNDQELTAARARIALKDNSAGNSEIKVPALPSADMLKIKTEADIDADIAEYIRKKDAK